MNRVEILKKLQEIIVKFNIYHLSKTDKVEDVLREDACLYEDLDFDELDISNLATRLENYFQVKVDENDLIETETLGEIVDYVADKIRKN